MNEVQAILTLLWVYTLTGETEGSVTLNFTTRSTPLGTITGIKSYDHSLDKFLGMYPAILYHLGLLFFRLAPQQSLKNQHLSYKNSLIIF